MAGIGFIIPAVVARLETGRLSAAGIGFIVAGLMFLVAGLAAVAVGFRVRRGERMPGAVRAALLVNLLLLMFLALELSDRTVRQEGKLFYWTTFLLPPALLLFVGLVAGRRWAWWAARGLAACGTLWFVGFLAIVPFAPLQANGVPAPWYGRVYVATLTVFFAAIFATWFRTLGSSEARKHFGLLGQPTAADSTPAA